MTEKKTFVTQMKLIIIFILNHFMSRHKNNPSQKYQTSAKMSQLLLEEFLQFQESKRRFNSTKERERMGFYFVLYRQPK
jgi:hypothetical protein